MMTSSPSTSIVLKPGTHIAKVVLMPGDPLRAKFIAENFLEDPVLFNDVRNMLGYTGKYNGVEVSVMGSGMGIPSIVLYATELFDFFGVEAIIRVGSAGGLGDSVKIRDVLVAMTASTNSNMQACIDMPGVIAPCADWELLKLAMDAAEETGVHAVAGNIYSSDFFYFPNPEAHINEKLRALGHSCVEMETAGLYLLAQTRGKKALSVLTISDHIFTGEALSAEERQESFHEMMEIALRAATRANI